MDYRSDVSSFPQQPQAGPSSVTLNSPSSSHASLSESQSRPIDPSHPESAQVTAQITAQANLYSQPPTYLTTEWTSQPPPPLKLGRRSSRPSRGRGEATGVRRGRSGLRRESARVNQQKRGNKAMRVMLHVKGGTGGRGSKSTSFLGQYDRDLNEHPEEALAFEEQFILRVPREVADGRGGEEGLRGMVKGKGKGLDGVEFKFLDSRRAAFTFNGVTYASKLVDLPCIVESQKTNDSRHLFKVADISQMLVVENPVKNEALITSLPLKVEDYVWQHGITPPLRHVRKRRFRKRLSRREIETVEQQVEALLKQDEVLGPTYEPELDFIDALPNAEVDDSYYIKYDPNNPYGEDDASDFGGSEAYHDPGSVAYSNTDWGEEGGDYQQADDAEGEDAYDDEDDGLDEELAAALMQKEDERADETDDEEAVSGSEDDDDEEEGDKSEDDEETVEKKAKIKQFSSEIKALEQAIDKKRAGFVGGANPIIVKRFEEAVAGMQGDLQTKVSARQVLVDELEVQVQEQSIPVIPAIQVIGHARGAEERDKDKGKDGQRDTTADGDDEMEEDAEGEDEDASTPMVATPYTPAPGTSPAQVTAAEDEDDDLFGEDDEESRGEERSRAGEQDEEDDDGEQRSVDDGEAGEADDFSAMLGESLRTMDTERIDSQDQADAAAALDVFARAGGLEQSPVLAAASSPAEDIMVNYGSLAGVAAGGGFGVEGGVGMRRMANGAVEDGEGDDSSEDSDD